MRDICKTPENFILYTAVDGKVTEKQGKLQSMKKSHSLLLLLVRKNSQGEKQTLEVQIISDIYLHEKLSLNFPWFINLTEKAQRASGLMSFVLICRIKEPENFRWTKTLRQTKRLHQKKNIFNRKMKEEKRRTDLWLTKYTDYPEYWSSICKWEN